MPAATIIRPCRSAATARKTDAGGGGSWRRVVRHSGTDYAATAQGLGTTYGDAAVCLSRPIPARARRGRKRSSTRRSIGYRKAAERSWPSPSSMSPRRGALYARRRCAGPGTIRAGAVTGCSIRRRSGPDADSLARAEANTAAEYDVLLYRGVSGPLAAQTISGTVDVLLGVGNRAPTNADLHYHLHVYVTQGDSDTPRGTLLTDYREAAGVNEWPNVVDESRPGQALTARASAGLAGGYRGRSAGRRDRLYRAQYASRRRSPASCATARSAMRRI